VTKVSEKETREKYINPILARVGWKINGLYVKEEINCVKSDFINKHYVDVSEGIEKEVDRFIDYLLLDEDLSPMAIIEAKKTIIDVNKGEIQARLYREQIEKQIGFKIPIFLTNGLTWFYVDHLDDRRQVALPFAQKDLHRIVKLMQSRKDPTEVRISRKIVDRFRGVEAVKVVLEHINENRSLDINTNRRMALLNMATGTGKTRVAMAIIDALIKSSYVQKVLFVVDRITLGSQAKENGFKKYFLDPVCELNTEGFSDYSRFYVSTIQTLMSEVKPRGRFYEKFGVAAFDLIIFDEAHRSYYDRNNDIFKYFDALKIGLTATPVTREMRDKSTYDLFGCEENKPTYKYEYEEAVLDKVLVPYIAEIIETKVLALGIEGKKLSEELRQKLRLEEEEPDKLQIPGSKFERIFTDEKTNELVIREFMDRCHKSADGRPCKSIFFCATIKHAETIEILFQRMYPMLGKDVKVITSDRYLYTHEIKNFAKRDSPRIALSVGVLDTGIDVPEIMNLVFVKPVISPIRFWQMLGRGTRNLEACQNRTWLPMHDGIYTKDDFLILDFKLGDWSNVIQHDLKAFKHKTTRSDAKTRIFERQLDLLEIPLIEKERKIAEKQVRDTLKSIDLESPLVFEKKVIIKKYISAKFEIEKHVEEVKKEVVPLLIYTPSENSKVYTFISQCVNLYFCIKEKDKYKQAKIEKYIIKQVNAIWDKNLEPIRNKRDDLIDIQKHEVFWESLTFEDVDFLIREIAPLMIYYEQPRKGMLSIPLPDQVINVQKKILELKENEDFKSFLENDPLMNKIKDGEGVTSLELLKIEKKLQDLGNRSWSIEEIQKSTDFILFLRGLLELKGLPDPQEMIKWEFDKLVTSRNEHYNSAQLKFLRLLEQVFIRAKHIELKDFAEHPLAEGRPLDVFTKEQLEVIVDRCNRLKWK